MSAPQQPQGEWPRPWPRRRDPFRILAIATIVLGLVIVIAAVVFWMLTGQQSSLMVGAGLALAGVGSMQRIASYYESQMMAPPPPPPAPPGPPTAAPPPIAPPTLEDPRE